MNLLAMFIAIGGAILVWWLLLQKLRNKPWLEAGEVAHADLQVLTYSPKLIALGVFLAVVTALFGLFGAAYHMRMAVPDWTHLPLPRILWANTFALALGSAALQWAWFAAASGNALPRVRHGLMAGACLTLAFLIGQVQAWRQLDASGFYFSCTPASAFFYLLSGLHGLHLLGGLAVLSKTIAAVYRPAASNTAPVLSIKLCALYWHYLLVLWLALYALVALT